MFLENRWRTPYRFLKKMGNAFHKFGLNHQPAFLAKPAEFRLASFDRQISGADSSNFF
jgi:hypothetical protein